MDGVFQDVLAVHGPQALRRLFLRLEVAKARADREITERGAADETNVCSAEKTKTNASSCEFYATSAL